MVGWGGEFNACVWRVAWYTLDLDISMAFGIQMAWHGMVRGINSTPSIENPIDETRNMGSLMDFCRFYT